MITEFFSIEPVAWLIRGGVLVAGVWVAALGVRRQAASVRALLWRGALVGLVVTALMVMGGWRVDPFSRDWAPTQPGVESGFDVNERPFLGGPGSFETTMAEAGAAGPGQVLEEPTEAGREEATASVWRGTSRDWSHLVWMVWGVGALMVFTRWACAHVRRWRMEVGSTDLRSDDRWSALLAEVAGEGARVYLRRSAEVTVPCAWGIARPTIVMPATADGWPLEHRRLALAHEWAHLQRQDPLWLVVAMIALALHWANPLAWMLVRRWRLTEEQVADDAALRHADPCQYATLLVACARSVNERSPSPVAVASMAHPSTVPARIRQILDPSQDRRPATRRQRLFTAVVCAGALAGVAAVTPNLVAQDTPAPSPAPSAQPAAPTVKTLPEPETPSPALSTQEKMQSIILPSVAFENASLEEAVEYFRLKSKELDTSTTDPKQRGVNFILRLGTERQNPIGTDRQNTSSSINLTNVPLEVAVKAVCDHAGVKFRVEPFAVIISDDIHDSTELYTKVFRVPPDFLNLAVASPAPGDPLAPKLTAMNILKQAGITFPEGGSAFFSSAFSTITVRNTLAGLDLTEQFVESIRPQLPKVINLRVEIYRLPKARALAVAESLDTELDATQAVKELRAQAGKADGTVLVAAPSMQTRSGQRARVGSGPREGSSGRTIEGVPPGGSTLADPGPATPGESTAPAGTPPPVSKSNSGPEGCLFEAEATLGADGYTLDVTSTVTFGSSSSDAGGLQTRGTGTLATATTVIAGQTRLLGTLASGEDRETMLLVFLKASVATPR